MLTPRLQDIIDQIRDLKKRVRRLEVRKQPGTVQYENFILDPATARTFPPAFAPASRLVRVIARLGAGGPIDVAMVIVQAGVPTTVHTFTALAGDGVPVTATVDEQLGAGDWMYPSITSGIGGDFTASFVLT